MVPYAVALIYVSVHDGTFMKRRYSNIMLGRQDQQILRDDSDSQQQSVYSLL